MTMKCQTCGAEIGFFKMMGHKKMHKQETSQPAAKTETSKAAAKTETSKAAAKSSTSKPAAKSAGTGGKSSGSAGKKTSRPTRK